MKQAGGTNASTQATDGVKTGTKYSWCHEYNIKSVSTEVSDLT